MGFTCKAKFQSTCNECSEPIDVGDTIHVLKEAEDGRKGTFHHRCFGKPAKSSKKPIDGDKEKEELRTQMERWFKLYTDREKEVVNLRAKVVELEKSLRNAKHMGL